MLLWLLLLCRTLAGLLRLTRAAASATTSASTRCLLLPGRPLRLLLLARRALLLALGARAALLLLLPAALRFRGTLALAVALALPFARRLLLLWSLFLAATFSCALLELADLLVHVPRRLPVVLETQLVMAAVRAALPSFRIGLLTGGAKDAFRERHREIGAHCTLRAVDENRRRTLLTLIELAGENSPGACWDDRRAMELLRKEASPEELRELGMDEQLLAQVFAEEHGR